MKIRLSDLKDKVKSLAELSDYLEMFYPEETDCIERISHDFNKYNDLLYNTNINKTVSDERVWIDTDTEEVEYE